LLLKCKIAEHDILSKANQIKKMISKGHMVRVVIGQAGETGDAVSCETQY